MLHSIDYHHLSLQVADIARRAGQFIRQEAQRFDRSRVESKGLHDLVSYVDQQSERQLVAELGALLPEAGFITEEGTTTIGRAEEYNWIIDPLDGTTNFIHGQPAYCVSVALLRGAAELVVGVVYEINQDECFRAAKGAGAFCNEQPLRVSVADDLHDSLVATGFPYYQFDQLDRYLLILRALMQTTHGIRRVGSAALDLAYVAAGRFDAYFEYNINSYDVAAGILLVREAGGRVTQFLHDGDPIFSRETLATNGLLHPAMQAVIGQSWQ